jgi:hypothetical protein
MAFIGQRVQYNDGGVTTPAIVTLVHSDSSVDIVEFSAGTTTYRTNVVLQLSQASTFATSTARAEFQQE